MGVFLARALSRSATGPGPDWYPKRLNLALPTGVAIQDLSAENNALAISPDGRRVAFANGQELYVRGLDQLEAVRLLEGVSDPFFSPDGRWLGFSRQTKLWRQSFQGGEPSIICDAPWVMIHGIQISE